MAFAEPVSTKLIFI